MFKKLLNRLKSKKALAAATILMAIALPVTVWAAWGPSRPVFDWNDPAQRVGSTTGPVFNSFIHTPSYGDERNFTTASPAGTAQWTDEINATPGQDVEVRVFVHNNANTALNDAAHDFKGIAHNTRVRLSIPGGSANGFDIPGYVSADNAAPQMVYDTATVRNNSQAFSLSYVPGSAKIYNNGPWKSGIPLSDDVVSASGTQIGYNALNGDLPGCFEYQAVITVRLHVNAPGLKFVKQVTSPGSSEMHKTMAAKPGDTVAWILQFENVGNSVMNDVTIRDDMPANATLVKGSILAFDVNRPSGQQIPDTGLSAGGVDLGNYGVNGGGFVRFRTTVNEPQNADQCVIHNVGFARAADVPEQSDDATVTIDSPVCHQQPAYSCDMLNVTNIGDRKYQFVTDATANGGARIVDYTYDFGDGTTPLLTDKATVEHTYAKDGSFVAKVTVRISVGSDPAVSVTSEACQQPIQINHNKPPVPPSGKLPNTGAGDVVGIFVATTIAGMIAYRVVWLRKFNQ